MATVTKDFLRSIRPEIDAALAVVAKSHGLQSLRLGNASFDPRAGSFTFRLEGVAEGALGKDAALYTHPSSSFLELPPLGAEFRNAGAVYKTAGLNSTGSKVICEKSDGKRYLFTVDAVKALCAEFAKVSA